MVLPWEVMLFDFVAFLLFSLCVPATQQMRLGCLCVVSMGLFALQGLVGADFPPLQPCWQPLSLFPTEAGCCSCSCALDPRTSQRVRKENLDILDCHFHLLTKTFHWAMLYFSFLRSAISCSHQPGAAFKGLQECSWP